MKTFKQYLREETEDDLKAEADRDREDMLRSSKILALLKKDCAPFMKECVHGGFLYRGITNMDESNLVMEYDEIEVYKKAVRSDRLPLNTEKETQVLYDNWFEKKFGYRVRSESMFCFGEDGREAARQYGRVFLVFPIGDFQYVWSPNVLDLQIHAESEYDGDADWDADDEPPKYELNEPNVNALLSKARYKKTGLRAALGSESEIMVRCKSYYAIPAEYVHYIHDLVM